MKIFFSNRVELLYQELKQELFLPDHSPFAHRLIVVPSPAVKNWLSERVAQDFGVAMGVKISYLEHTLAQLRDELVQSKAVFPTNLSLVLAIEEQIRELCLEDTEVWEPLRSYLGIDQQNKLSRKAERRLIALCDVLGTLFEQYGVYGGALIEEWERSEEGGWQGVLWRRLFCEGIYRWSYPTKEYAHLKSLHSPARDTSLYLFSMSYFSKVHFEFLKSISTIIPTKSYLLSPCQSFWSDVLSDKEAGRLQTYWKKRGVSQEQRGALEHYLSDRNPLLANYGKLGREMAKILEQSDVSTESCYGFSKAVLDQQVYQDLIVDDVYVDSSDNPLTILDAIQADLGLMRNPYESQIADIQEEDDSIQVHQVSSHLREIEVVHDVIMKLIDRDKILPEEIIVMAPQIGDYVPHIKYVFEKSKLDYQIMDLSTPLHNSAIKGFLDLLAIPFGRWDAVSILKLLECKPFREKNRLRLDDLETITKWLQDTGVYWGDSLTHREELLQRDHKDATIVARSAKGTWEHALGQLLQGLVMRGDSTPVIDASKGELLGLLIDLLQNLKKDLKCVHDGSKKDLPEWIVYLKQLAEKYFRLDEEAESILSKQLEQFQRASEMVGAISVGFSSIQKRLKNLLAKQQGVYRESHLHSVRFCSMLPMRAIPARAIVLMGMQEGKFPKKGVLLSLNQCLQHPDKTEFSPSEVDYDRFLFLEALLSARDYLIFTYQGVSQEDGKEQPPNILLSELLHYIENAYGRELAIRKHPQYGFASKDYYADIHYSEAVAYYKKEKTPAHLFLKGISGSETTEEIVELKHFESLGKNPLKLYLNHSLDFYLKYQEEAIKGIENFELSPLDRYLLEKECLRESTQTVLARAEQYGNLPLGVFGEIEKKRICSDLQQMIIPDHLFSLTLSDDCVEPKCDENGCWTVPALKTDRGISIVGTFPDVSQSGIFLFYHLDKEDVVKAWPGYLVFHAAVKRFQIPIGVDIQFGKDSEIKTPFFEDAMEHLNRFCDYYALCKQEASPLLPDWIFPLLFEDDEKLQSKIEKKQIEYDVYLNWLFRGSRLPDAAEMKKKWMDQARVLYEEPLRQWCGK